MTVADRPTSGTTSTAAERSVQPYLGGTLAPSPDELVVPGKRTVTGEVVRLHPASAPDGSWVRATLRTDDGVEFPCVGRELPEVEPGCRVELHGYWDVHREHGSYFQVMSCRSRTLPVTAEGVIRFLAGSVPHCREARAKQLVQHFGVSCIELLAGDPTLVRRVFDGRLGDLLEAGLTEWAQRLDADEGGRRLAARLVSAGVSVRLARQIISFFRTSEVAEMVALRDPYRLLDVPGIGWKRADAAAQLLGVTHDAPERLTAALEQTLRDGMRHGHSCLEPKELRRYLGRLLGDTSSRPVGPVTAASDVDRALAAVPAAEDEGRVVVDHGSIYLPDALEHEWQVGRVIARLRALDAPLSALQRASVEAVLAGTKLSATQQGAVIRSLEHGISLLTGRPGAGKTTTTAAFLACCDALGWTVTLAAPTGKAAARATEVTGRQAQTIHRLLAVTPGALRESPIRAGVLVVDEVSMCSLETMAWLLQNIDPARTRVLLIGDPEQLPSVEHGAVLRDLMESGGVPATHLTEIFRQARGSRLVTNAHALLDGQPLDLLERGDDFRFVPVGQGGAESEEHGADCRADEIECALLTELRLLLATGAQSAKDVQVLSPLRRGRLGVVALNQLLQPVLNPLGEMGPEIGAGQHVRLGDRVIQVRNDYTIGEVGLFNGEQGVVVRLDPDGESLELLLDDGRRVAVRGIQRYNLHLAWAVTVHRSQGSEYPYVMLVYDHAAHAAMLDLRLLYTAMTRAKRRFTLIGTSEALRRTQSGGLRRHRSTGLARHVRIATGAPVTPE